MYAQDIHPSHQLSNTDFGTPGWTPSHAVATCLLCGTSTCVLCPPGSPFPDDKDLAQPCAKSSDQSEPRQLPLRVVLDDIARPPGTIEFGPGTAWIPGGGSGVFQIGSGTITFTLAVGEFIYTAKQVQELADRLDELTRKGGQAAEDVRNAIESGTFCEAKPADPGDAA